MDGYNNQNYGQELQNPYTQPSQPENKEPKNKSHFGGGMLLGIFLGILLSAGLGYLGLNWYSSVTGGYIVLGKGQVSHVTESAILDDATVDKISEVSSYIDVYYNGEVDDAKLRNALVAGMVKGLGDPYSVYYTPEEYQDLQISTTGTYYGIGAGLSQDPDTMVVTITKIYKGTPSEEAGLLKDDIIQYVDGVDATSEELTPLVQRIRGEEGTSVHLQVYRPSTKETLDFDVVRRNVELPSVESQMIDDRIGYILISEFQTNTDEQFAAAVQELQQQGMKGLIVDVRDNPGGLVNSVSNILDQLLPEGLTVYTEDKYGTRNELTSDASCVDFPITVLVNGNSASASEIFAGAIKDYNYGTIIGTKTFGKGIVQTIFPLKDGDALKVTTAKYFTPNGNYIHGVGIEPDIELEYEYSGDKDKGYDMQYDNQLQKAIEVLNEKMD